MKLTFKEIEINNFLSFGQVSFNYDKLDGMTLITGKNNDIPGSKNGCGKSNLFSALVYALFGELPNKINRVNIPNRMFSESDQTLIVLNFTAGKNEYRITRGLTKKYRAAFCKLEKLDSTQNWVDLTKSSLSITQKFINDEVLKTDISLFLRSMLLSADQTYNFFKLNSGQKKDFIENLFGLDFYNNLYTAIHQDVLSIDKDLNIKEHTLLTTKHLLQDYISSSSDWENNINQTQENLKRDIAAKVQHYKSLQAQLSVESEKNKQLGELRDKILTVYDQVNNKIQDLEKTKLKHHSKITSLQATIKSRKKVLDKHLEVLTVLCDDCKAAYNKLTDYSELFKANEDDSNLITDYSNNIDKVNADLTKLQTKLTEIKEKRDALITDINIINLNISSLASELTIEKSLILQCRQQLDKKIENPYQSFIEKTKKDLEIVNTEITEITDRQNYLKTAESIVSQDTIKRFIIRDMLSLLNTRIAYYLNKIGARYTCEFDDDMNYTFITETGFADYNNFSSGERTRLAIATSFAFRDFMATRSGVSSNVLILDEYMDSNLDSMAIEGLLSILKEFLALYGQRVYVISHRSEVDSALFNNTVLVEKTNNISTLTVNQSEHFNDEEK